MPTSAEKYNDWKHDDDLWLQELAEHPHVQAVMHIPPDEPMFYLRSQDIYGPDTVDFWIAQASRTISPKKFEESAGKLKLMIEWQNQNQDKVKIPD